MKHLKLSLPGSSCDTHLDKLFLMPTLLEVEALGYFQSFDRSSQEFLSTLLRFFKSSGPVSKSLISSLLEDQAHNNGF